MKFQWFKNNSQHHVNQGQSLIEVVVAIGMMALLLVALLTLISLSVKNSRLSKNRTMAVELSQEGVELMRAYRDYSWSEFNGLANNNSYVLIEGWTVETGLSETGCDETNYMNEEEIFSRCVRLYDTGDDSVGVEVTTYWQEGNQLKQAVQTTRLSIWEV